MRLSLTRKLFASFMALTCLVLVATLGLARWSFERGFLDYVNAIGNDRLERLAADLEKRYAAAGDSWDTIDEAAFERMLARYMSPRRPLPASDGRPARRTGPRIALFDADGRRIVGPALDSDARGFVRRPVGSEANPIGELHTVLMGRFESSADSDFARQQARRSVLIGVVALALAALVSLSLARALLAPVRASMATVARLSSGDFTPPPAGQERRPDADGDELARLAHDLERLRTTLHAGRGARRRLLADISHELRTPLTILAGEVAALRDGTRAVDAERLGSLAEEVERLQALVDDLNELALSDIGGLRYAFEPLSLDARVVEAVSASRQLAADAGLELAVESSDPVAIDGDARRLHQLFTNLLANAIAYTDAPGRVVVSVGERDGEARVRVDDTPPGVADTSERLFESLYRDAGTRDRRRGGTGLGLAICRNIVDAHGGRIAASDSPLGGLRIDVHLPLTSERERADSPHPGRRGRGEDRAPGARLPAT